MYGLYLFIWNIIHILYMMYTRLFDDDDNNNNEISMNDFIHTAIQVNVLTLNNVNFRVRPGELVIVAGPVGCGKSSLLMAILGELPLLTGSVNVNGNIAYASQVCHGLRSIISNQDT